MAWQNEETYVYDETNHMVDGKNEKGERSLYTYNGLGLRVGRELIMEDNTHGYTDFHDETPSVETGIDKPEVAKESYVIDYTSPTFRTLVMEEEGGFDYRWVYGLDKLSVKITSEGTNWWGQNVKQDILKDYLHQDRLGSTTNLTDKFGRVVGRADYNEWGEITYKDALDITSAYRRIYPQLNYTGHDWDDVLEMYYAKARFYDPDAKRFVEIDPVKGQVTDPLSLVSYLYCVDNPLRWVDPLGLKFDDPTPSNAKAGTYLVTGDGVRLRSEPSLNGKTRATLPERSKVTSSGRRKAGSGLYWLQVKDNATGITGWMAEKYLVYLPNPEQHRQEMNEKRIDAATSPVPPAAPKPNPMSTDRPAPGSTYPIGPTFTPHGTSVVANPNSPYAKSLAPTDPNHGYHDSFSCDKKIEGIIGLDSYFTVIADPLEGKPYSEARVLGIFVVRSGIRAETNSPNSAINQRVLSLYLNGVSENRSAAVLNFGAKADLGLFFADARLDLDYGGGATLGVSFDDETSNTVKLERRAAENLTGIEIAHNRTPSESNTTEVTYWGLYVDELPAVGVVSIAYAATCIPAAIPELLYLFRQALS